MNGPCTASRRGGDGRGGSVTRPAPFAKRKSPQTKTTSRPIPTKTVSQGCGEEGRRTPLSRWAGEGPGVRARGGAGPEGLPIHHRTQRESLNNRHHPNHSESFKSRSKNHALPKQQHNSQPQHPTYNHLEQKSGKHLTHLRHPCYNRNQALIRRPPEKRQRIAASGGRNLRCSCRRLK